MNWVRIEGQWKQTKGKVMEQRGQLRAGCFLVALLVAGCAVAPGPGGPVTTPRSPGGADVPAASRAPVDPRYVQQLQEVLPPLLNVMDAPLSPEQVQIGIVQESAINAANAGGGRFLVTTGLLEKASDRHLLAIMAHEVAHQDLGHVAKAQVLGAGIDIASAVLQSLFPAAGGITPIAGELVSRAYSRSEEYAADEHAVTLLKRLNHPAASQLMADTLSWIHEEAGGGNGGFFSTHPATGDRIERIRQAA